MKTTPKQNMTRRVGLALLTSLILTTVVLPKTAFANAEVYKQTIKSTTWIITKSDGKVFTGSGVLIDVERRLVITNYHVVANEREVLVFFAKFKDGNPITERKYYRDHKDEIGLKGRVLAVDRSRDLAIVQLPKLPDGVQAIEFAEQSVTPGQKVHSLGNAPSTEALWAYTSGTVRAVYRKKFRTESAEHDFTVVETQLPFNAGDSGGPIVNDDGKLVALTQSMHTRARLVSFSVDVSEIRNLLSEDWKPAPLPVATLLKQTGLKFKRHASGPYAVEFTGNGSAPQSVFVSDKTEYYNKAEVRKVWALATVSKQSLTSQLALLLLQQNARTKLGAWTIEQNASGEILIIFCAKIDATASAETLRSSMEYVSKVSASMSRQIVAGTNQPKQNTSRSPENQPATKPVAPADVKQDDWFGGYKFSG